MSRHRNGWAVAALCAAALSPAATRAQSLSYSGNLSYAGGSYIFDEEVNSFYFGSALSLTTERFRLTLTAPVIIQNGGIVSYVAGIPIPTGGSQNGLVQRRGPGQTMGTRKQSKGHGSGGGGGPSLVSIAIQEDTVLAFDDAYRMNLGDPSLSGSIELSHGFEAVRSLTIEASVKAPLTSVEDGVGSGEWDYSVGGGVAIGAGRGLIFGDLRYWWLGDLAELELADGLSYGLGASLPFADGRGSGLVSFSGMTTVIESMDAPVSASGSIGYRVRDSVFLSTGISVGLSESASDLVIYFGWSLG